MPRSYVPTVLLIALVCLPVGASRADEVEVRVDDRLTPLRHWLEGDDAILRAMAAYELRHHDEEGAVHLATGVLVSERDPIVVGCALGSLEVRARPELVAEGGPVLAGLLVRLVGHEHPLLRERAWRALQTLGGKEIESSSGDLRAWWLANRRALAEEQGRVLEARRAPPPAGGAPLAPGETQTVPARMPTDLYEYVTQLRRDGLEICIVMDHTGSMAQVIGRASLRAAALVKHLGWLVPRFRAGLVTYDDGARLRVALTSDGEVLQKAFAKVTAGGGGDMEEGVDKGIALALRQERLGWSQSAWRVIVVIGDAPPHTGDVTGLLRRIGKAREDDLFDHPIIVSTVSTRPGGVAHFEQIAVAGGGLHVTLQGTSRLVEELVALSFGSAHRERVGPWLAEVRELKQRTPPSDR